MRIGYARVSTKEQNLDAQLDALERAGCERIYQEKASGRKTDRAELAKLLDFIRTGDTLVVWKLDRLGRDMKQLVNLLNDFQENGINFVSITDGLDTSTPIGRCMFGVTAAFAQLESDLARERTLSGLEAARRRGNVGGRPKKKQEDVERAFMAVEGGMTVREACGLVGISPTTYYRYKRAMEENDT